METLELKNPFTNAEIVGVDFDPTVYHTLKGQRGTKDFMMSNSSLKEFAACPRKWKLGGEEEKDTDATEWGTLVDALALTPMHMRERFAVTPETYPDTKTGEPKPWTFNANHCKAWKAEQVGKTIVKPCELLGAQDAVKRLHDDPQIDALINCSERQVFVQAEYHDRDTNLIVPVKGLIDLVPDKSVEFYGRCIADLKTIRNGKPAFWKREVFLRGYHIQATLYLWLYVAATGEDRTDFLHVLSENVPPYEPGRRLLSNEFQEAGRRFIIGALRHYCQCLATGIWPDYDWGTQNIRGWTIVSPESWMMAAEQDFPPFVDEVPVVGKVTSDPNDLIP